MSGTNAGTGQPVSFQCGACRRTTGPCRWWDGERYTRCNHAQRRTGRTRPYNGGNTGQRGLRFHHEYVCDCGHRGWSRIKGVERLPMVQADRAPGR